MGIKETILSAANDLMADFLAYRRQEDKDLPPGRIEEALRDGEITTADILYVFENALRLARDRAKEAERSELESYRRL